MRSTMRVKTPPPHPTQTAQAFQPPSPDKVVSVPISVWAEYLRLYNLEVVGCRDGVILTTHQIDRHESDKHPMPERRDSQPPGRVLHPSTQNKKKGKGIMKKQYTSEEADKLVKNWTTGIVTTVLLFVNFCLPVLVVGGLLYWIFGR